VERVRAGEGVVASEVRGRPLAADAETGDGPRRATSSILATGETIAPDDLPPHIASGAGLGPVPALPAQRNLAEVEKAHIIQTLERCGWNHSRAADALGIGRTTLWCKLKEYGLDRTEREG
jgi:DNA-binding NtrC family response regulator